VEAKRFSISIAPPIEIGGAMDCGFDGYSRSFYLWERRETGVTQIGE